MSFQSFLGPPPIENSKYLGMTKGKSMKVTTKRFGGKKAIFLAGHALVSI